MTAQRNAQAPHRRLPPFGREIVAMVRAGRRPAILGGSVVVSLDWKLGAAWPRIVLPRDTDPHEFDLAFLVGLDVLIVYRPDHPWKHVAAALEAVRAVRPRVCASTPLPHAVDA